MPANSAQHNQIWLANAAGTVVEWTSQADQINVHVGNADRDGTTFKAGGLSIAETHTKGTLVSSVDVRFKYSVALMKHLRQIVGSISGFYVRTASGSNAAPTYGDEVFEGTMTMLAPQITGAPGQTVMVQCTFVPADGGATAPTLKLY